MQLFYAPELELQTDEYAFNEEESRHCVRVLRLGCGDSLHLTNGRGLLARAEVADSSPKHCRMVVRERWPAFEKRGYHLTLAVAPTKNLDRFEWFVEKATEFGVDRIVPLLTEHSERKVLKTDRIEKVAISAMKQSLKAYCPVIEPLTPFSEWIERPLEGVRLIAHCEKQMPRIFIGERLQAACAVTVLIGPEGDFSPQEILQARAVGFCDISLGHSRLRTETAAVAAVAAVAFVNELKS